MSRTHAIALNALGLYAIAAVLIVAFVAQFVHNELPCPLCLLQRIMFAMLAVGPILNIRHGLRPSHYALSLLAAVIGAAVAGRQILLHILPGDPGYGSALFGYHYYTWAFIAFAAAIVLIALVMAGDPQFSAADEPPPGVNAFASLAVWLVIALTAANAVLALLECGFAACADDPKVYELLKRR